METRVLTLFDDDFFQQEEPKKKPGKASATKDTTVEAPETQADTQDQPIPEAIPETETPAASIEAEPEPAVAEDPEPETEQVPATAIADLQAEANVYADNDIIDAPKNTIPEEVVALAETSGSTAETADTVNEEVVLNIGPAEEEEDVQMQAEEADDALNKQILSELIQMDYTALIHRDYPFDLRQAAVVEKHKPAPVVPTELTAEDVAEEEDDEVFEDLVPLPEWKLDKKYYTIGEVAQLFAVNTSHIRFWTNEFKLKPRTTRKGDRLYNPKDIAELRLIHHLVKEKKHTIKGAREKLKAGKNDVHNKLDLKDALTTLRDTLLQIRAQL